MDTNRPARKIKFAPKPRAPKQVNTMSQQKPSTGQVDETPTMNIGDGSSSSKEKPTPDPKSITLQQEDSSTEQAAKSSTNIAEGSSSIKEKFAWDPKSNYPITLPWKSGDLDDATMYDESTINSAAELGLLEKKDAPQMILFQFPPGSALDNRPEEHMGKLLVYKSGDVKMKIGDILFDVSPGTKRLFAQDVVAINTDEKHCCAVGALDNNAVVTLDS